MYVTPVSAISFTVAKVTLPDASVSTLPPIRLTASDSWLVSKPPVHKFVCQEGGRGFDLSIVHPAALAAELRKMLLLGFEVMETSVMLIPPAVQQREGVVAKHRQGTCRCARALELLGCLSHGAMQPAI